MCSSLVFFDIYLCRSTIVKDLLENIEEGVKVGGKLLKGMRFADDKAFVANTEKGLSAVVNIGDKYNTRLNFFAIKIMKIGKRTKKL